MTSRRWIVAALVALSLLAAGCGKDSSKKKASTTATTVATFPPGTTLDVVLLGACGNAHDCRP